MVLERVGRFYLLCSSMISAVSKKQANIFADDLKMMGTVKSTEQCKQIQNDLTKITEWATKWGMSFSVKKCQTLHLRKNNANNFPMFYREKLFKRVI